MNSLEDPTITIPFSKVLDYDIGVVGQKGHNLGTLLSLKVPVPNGFVISSYTFDHHFFSNRLNEFIKKELTLIDPTDSVRIENASMRIRRGILKFNIDETLSKLIVKAYGGISGFSDVYVAVRSSSLLEELKLDSFTGQHSTYLNIRGKDDLVEKVKYCWASLFSPKNIFYAMSRGIDMSTMKMAVVVQKMVQAEASGILFTVNPIDNNPARISIDAVLGLGEVLASGQINPDTYVIDKESKEIVEKHIVPQDWMLVRKGRSKKGEDPNVKVTVSEVWKSRQKIDTKHIQKLVKIGNSIESHFGKPQEVEWTYEGGKIWIVQSRAMSILRNEDPDAWKKSPTVEALKSKIDTRQEVKVEKKPIQKSSEPTVISPLQATPGLPVQERENLLLLNGKGIFEGVVSGPLKKVSSPRDINSGDKGIIIVTQNLDSGLEEKARQIIGVIVDGESLDPVTHEIAAQLGVPCVVNTQIGTKILKDGEVVTINGSTGEVLSDAISEGLLKAEKLSSREDVDIQVSKKGSKLKEPKKKVAAIKEPGLKSIRTATKVFANLDDPDTAQAVAAQQVDGVCILDSEKMVKRMGIHPSLVLKNDVQKDQYINNLSIQLYRFGRVFEPRTIIYTLADLTSDEYRQLQGGQEVEIIEQNPMMGFRGVNRLMTNNEEVMLELEALKIVRNKENIRNIWIAIPFVRTYSELREIKQMIAAAGFRRSASFKLFFLVEVPSAVIRIEKLLSLGIDGVIINTDTLIQTLLSFDVNNPRVQADYKSSHPALMWSIERVVKACNKSKAQSFVTGDVSQQSKLIAKLVELGVTGISSKSGEIDYIRQEIVDAERRLITRKKQV